MNTDLPAGRQVILFRRIRMHQVSNFSAKQKNICVHPYYPCHPCSCIIVHTGLPAGRPTGQIMGYLNYSKYDSTIMERTVAYRKTVNRGPESEQLSLTFALRQPYGMVLLFPSAQTAVKEFKK